MPGEGEGGGGGTQIAGGAVAYAAGELRTFRKGPFLAKLDKKSREVSLGDAVQIRKTLEELRAKPGDELGLSAVIATLLSETHTEDRKHVYDHWLSGWKAHHSERILVNGLIKAIDAAIEGSSDPGRVLPFDCYWIAGGEQFEVVVTCSPWQVNVLIFTPRAEGPLFQGRYSQDEEVWSVRAGAAKRWEKTEYTDASDVITTKMWQRPPGNAG